MFERLLTIFSAANAWRRPRTVIVGAGFGGLAGKIRREVLGGSAAAEKHGVRNAQYRGWLLLSDHVNGRVVRSEKGV
jgi:hypothetical protein